MKNERCLIKKIIEFKEKIVKICIIFIGLTFLMGFYDERNMYFDLEEITIELGESFPLVQTDYITNYLSNSNFFLEDNVPKDLEGQANKIGTYSYYIVYRDEERMYSRLTNKRSTISVIDTIKPEIKLKETSLKFEYGSDLEATDVADCYDLSTCELSFKTEVDTKKSGTHEVVVVAKDESDNISEEIVNITIKEKPRRGCSANCRYMNNYNNSKNSHLSDEQKISLRYELIEFAKQFAGNPYVYGGTSLTNGADCSGFVQSIYANFGYLMPRSAKDQGYMGKSISYSQLLPGDIIAYDYTSGGHHVGIYIGNGLMIHAATPEAGIVIAPIFSGNRTYSRIIY